MAAEAEEVCPHCGKPVPSTALDGLCPECMLVAALPSQNESYHDRHPAQVPHPPPPRPDEIAALFPTLEILECLGRGGMGAVYKARQPKLDRYVAIKILAREREGDPKFAERFEREARALARLNHPNIVTVHDFGQTAGLYFLLMEYVDGLTLRQLIHDGTLTPEEALAIVPRICEALQFAHEHGIVHRDIKPENILVDRLGRVKIADFGIARIIGTAHELTHLTGDQQVIGTPHYMAPEQIEAPQRVDHRADIFSLGVVFYEMLTGELPLGKFQPPSCKMPLDVRLDDIVLRALEKEPDRRYQHAREVKTDLETITANKGVHGSSESRETASESSRPSDVCPATAMRQRWVRIARWSARVLGTLSILLVLPFVLAEGLPPIATQPGGVQLTFAGGFLLLLGFIIGWWREGAAALLIAAGWTVVRVSETRLQFTTLFESILVIAALYAFCWWSARPRRTAPVGGAVAMFVIALILGRLFCPSSVLLQGVVRDAATGRPIEGAAVTLLPKPAREPDEPNARSGAGGGFNLYVGWYAEQKNFTVASPGYATLTTNLGPRALGQRLVPRYYSLQPTVEHQTGDARDSWQATWPSEIRLPPVIVETVPASGAENVDPGLTEIRVTYSAAMADTAGSWSAWNNYPRPEILGAARYLADGRTCVLPVNLLPGRVYALCINATNASLFRDRDGNAALPYLLIFKTGGDPAPPH